MLKCLKNHKCFSMRLTLQNCVGVTAAATHPQEDLIADSDSWQPPPTNPLFSAFDLGGGKASDLAFTETGDHGQK